MTQIKHIYPSKEAVYRMYKFLTEYEQSISKCHGEFNISSKDLELFLKQYDIYLLPVSKAKYVKDLPRKNYIVFTYGDHKTDYPDKAHDLLRHLRNAIGHALITKTSVNKTCFRFTDKNKSQSITMRGNMEETLFFALIDQLIKTKK